MIKKRVVLSLIIAFLSCQAKQPVGLQNLGNTCYQNGSLQPLMNLAPLTTFLVDNKNNFKKDSLAQKFIELKENISISSEPYKPQAFCSKALAQFGFAQGTQQDAYEFVTGFLNSIAFNDYISRDVQNNDNPVENIYSPIMKIVMSSDMCQANNRWRFERDGVIFLNVKNTLQASLENYVAPEDVDLYCASEGGNTPAEKRTLFYSAPPVLIFGLKRFYQMGTKPAYKIVDPVRLPLFLDISPFMDDESPEKDDALYELKGVTVHSGSLTGGHYWAYVNSDGQWYKADDSSVTQLTQQQVDDLTSRGYIESRNATPYLFYYERVGRDGKRSLSSSVLSLSDLQSSIVFDQNLTEAGLMQELLNWGLSETDLKRYLGKDKLTQQLLVQQINEKKKNLQDVIAQIDNLRERHEEEHSQFSSLLTLLLNDLERQGVSQEQFNLYLMSIGRPVSDIIADMKKGEFIFESFILAVKDFFETQEKALTQSKKKKGAQLSAQLNQLAVDLAALAARLPD